MDESFEADDFEDAGAGELAAGELASIGQDWDVVMQMLPAQWEAKALELGAVRRLRGFDSVGSLLRVLLIHLADGCSLRETAVRASAGGLCVVSDVALLKRLRGCAAWFEWMARELALGMALPLTAQALLPGRRVRLVDGSSVCEPGATGSTWRLHYALNLHTLSCDEVHVSEAGVGESLTHFDIRAGDVIMADRGFAKRPGLRYAVQRKADVVLRASLSNLPLHDRRGRPLDLFPLLRSLAVGQAADWPARVQDDMGAIAVRVCAYKKTAAQTLASQQAIQQEARKKGRSVQPQTLEAAGYVIVVTTLSEPAAAAIMEFYRRRWQIELAFKRLKSLLQLGHLKKTDKDGAKAWLQGKLLVACLIEKLILTAERFSPWGYIAADSTGAGAPLTLA
jgi:Transposase DDE domain